MPKRANTVCHLRLCVNVWVLVWRSCEVQVDRQTSSYCWPVEGRLCGKDKCCRLWPMWALFICCCCFLYLVHRFHRRHLQPRSTCLHLHAESKRTGVLAALHTRIPQKSFQHEQTGVITWGRRVKAQTQRPQSRAGSCLSPPTSVHNTVYCLCNWWLELLFVWSVLVHSF